MQVFCVLLCAYEWKQSVKGHILIINSDMIANLKYADIICNAKHLNLLLFADGFCWLYIMFS